MAALALRTPAPLKPEILLAQSISEFQTSLPPGLRTKFDDMRRKALNTAPTADDVTRFTADLNMQIRKSSPLHRCFGTRFTNILQAVQRYAALGDVVIGGSQNITACGVWALVRVTIQVCIGLGSYLDKISHFFMTAGQSAPRYESMAHLYRRSTRLSQCLASYFIVIVQTCRQFVQFSQKSLLGQLASSLDDSKIRDAQSTLERWGHSIQEEISFLTTETVEDEANENGMFRAMVGKAYSWEAHQRKFRHRAQLLQALSGTDHETPYKQARKCGSSTIFQDQVIYDDWRDADDSSSLILMGKLGSGKSVTMANIVDNLLLSEQEFTVAYFFCRHDNAGSLTARAVIGSLGRQLVTRYFDDSLLQNVADGCPVLFNMDDVFRLITSVVPPDEPIHFILDGIDEMLGHEANEVMKALKDLQHHMILLVCASIRSGTQDYSSLFSPLANVDTFLVPEENPDISSFIDEELQRRIESKQLLLGNEVIVLEIRDSLIKGANGMFLWVALQIDCLCEEKSDNAIRRALQNLPPDLFTTFGRILDRSQASVRTYQPKILKLIVAAQRPLSVDELREAISVEPGVVTWNPDDLVNDIYGVLACCGSLVLVDEENLTVRLIHQSVAQFLLIEQHAYTTAAGVNPRWHFTSEQAQIYLGECAVTYLNYSLFETRITSQVAHEVQIGALPSHIINQTLAPTGIAGQLAMMLLKPNTTPEFDAKRALIEAASRRRRDKTAQLSHFLGYASQYWLLHTSWITEECKLRHLWLQLLENPRFNSLTWTEGSAPRDALIVDSETGFIWQFSERVMWAIANSHIPLFQHEMRGKGWWKALCTVVPYLRRCRACKSRLRICTDMCTKLLPLVAMFESSNLLDWLCSMGAKPPFDPTSGWPGSLSDRDYLITRAILSHNESQFVNFRSWPLLQIAIEKKDAKMVQVLVNRRQTIPLERVFANDLYDPGVVKIVYHLFQGSSRFHRYDFQKLPVDVKTLHGVLNQNYFDIVTAVFDMQRLPGSAQAFKEVVYAAMRRYCLFQDSKLTLSLLPVYRPIADQNTRISFLLAVLHSRSPERSALAKVLWESLRSRQSEISRKTVLRCMQLRLWPLAMCICEWEREEAKIWVPGIRRYARDHDLLHYCASASDAKGIQFLKIHAEYRLDSLVGVSSQYFQFQTPLEAAFRARFENWSELNELMETTELLLSDEAYEWQLAFPFEAYALLVANVCALIKRNHPVETLTQRLNLCLGIANIMSSMLTRSSTANKIYAEEAAQGLLWSLLSHYLYGASHVGVLSDIRSPDSLYFLFLLIQQVLLYNTKANREILELIISNPPTMDNRLKTLINDWFNTFESQNNSDGATDDSLQLPRNLLISTPPQTSSPTNRSIYDDSLSDELDKPTLTLEEFMSDTRVNNMLFDSSYE